MMSLLDQFSFQIKPPSPKRIRHAKPVGYAGRTRQLEIRTAARYIEALSKRRWSDAKQLMEDLGLKCTAGVTKTMSRDYMKAVSIRKEMANNKSGSCYYQWRLKP